LTGKGQVTVPKAVREDLGLTAGSQVSFTREADGSYRMERLGRPVARLAGALRYDGPPKTLEDMDRGIAQAAAEGLG
jgi:AbrB family looped-hinge helix DNA binding protein